MDGLDFVLQKGFVFQEKHSNFVLFIDVEDAVPAKSLGGDVVGTFRAEQGAVEGEFPDAPWGLLNLFLCQVIGVSRQFQKTQDAADIVARVPEEEDILGLGEEGHQLIQIENQVWFFDNFFGEQVSVAMDVPFQRKFFLKEFDFGGSWGSPEQVDGFVLAGCDGQQRGNGG